MAYKKGLTKAKFTSMMRMFWTQKWKYERTPQEWADAVHFKGPQVIWSTPTGVPSPMYQKPPYGIRAVDMLSSAVDKLVLEKKLKKEEGESLKNMLKGSYDDTYIAVSAMAVLKPKKFKTHVEELSGV